jgi:hypothetical protein
MGRLLTPADLGGKRTLGVPALFSTSAKARPFELHERLYRRKARARLLRSQRGLDFVDVAITSSLGKLLSELEPSVIAEVVSHAVGFPPRCEWQQWGESCRGNFGWKADISVLGYSQGDPTCS